MDSVDHVVSASRRSETAIKLAQAVLEVVSPTLGAAIDALHAKPVDFKAVTQVAAAKTVWLGFSAPTAAPAAAHA